MIDLSDLTIKKAHDHLTRGDFSVKELTDAYLESIKKNDPLIHAYLEVFSDAGKQAEVSQQMLKEGKGGTLVGIPIATKDNILIKGKKASAASKILENYTATYDSTVVHKLKDAGVVFLGRTNMDEFAMGSSTENSAYGPTKNPFDTTRVAGGSSGGSAAAVAMNGALASLGSDTAGSVRQPASFCGCVGLKTTYGSVSRSGLIAMASSLDQIGPITKTVTDSEILFNAIKGRDPLDSTTIPDEIYSAMSMKGGVKDKLVVGVPRHLIEMEGIDKEVVENFNASVDKLEELGYETVDISLPNAKYSLPSYYIIMPGEVSSNLARFDGMRFGLHVDGANLLEDYAKSRGVGFGKETRRRILLGTYVLSSGYYDAYYNKAKGIQELIGRDFKNAFEKVDAIVLPTTPTPAFKLGEKTTNPLSMYLADIFTVISNIVGIPTISVPSGMATVEGKNLPLGLQILTSHCKENLLFKIGKSFLGEE